VAVGEKNWIDDLSPCLSRLSFVDWVTGGERQRGGEINRCFLVASKAPSGYSTFGLRQFWYERDLGVVGPASKPRRVAQTFGFVSKTGFGFGVQNSVWNLVGLLGVWLAGGVPVHCGVDVEFRRAGFRGWLRYVCVCVFYVESL
jgi:hypothetical protein